MAELEGWGSRGPDRKLHAQGHSTDHFGGGTPGSSLLPHAIDRPRKQWRQGAQFSWLLQEQKVWHSADENQTKKRTTLRGRMDIQMYLGLPGDQSPYNSGC